MTEENISAENAKKLDRILLLLEGEPEVPGLLANVNSLKETVFGRRGELGLVGKTTIMWRAHVWVLCSLSAMAGYLLRHYVHL